MSLAIVTSVDDQRPQLLEANTHQTDAHFLYFCCQALGPSWRLVSKSGGENGYTWPNGIRTSHDAICQVNGEGSKIATVDIIASAGNGVATSPAWDEKPPHQWRPSNLPVKLSQVPMPGGETTPPPPKPCPDPSAHLPKPPIRIDRGQSFAALRFLDEYYKAPEGLQRPDGVSLHGKADLEGIAAWHNDVYLNARLDGQDHLAALALVVKAIRQSTEWQAKHPGETP